VHALVRAARRAGVQPWKVGEGPAPDVGLVEGPDGPAGGTDAGRGRGEGSR
jgi:hypothetical protein